MLIVKQLSSGVKIIMSSNHIVPLATTPKRDGVVKRYLVQLLSYCLAYV